MVFAHIAVPSACSSRRTGNSVADGIFAAEQSNLLEALLGDDVVAKDIHIFAEHWLHILAQSLDVCHEVRVYIVLQSAYAVVVLNKSTTRGFLHYVEHMLAITHTVEERRECSKVLSTTSYI